MRLRVGIRIAVLACLLCAAGASAQAAQSDLLLAYDVRYGGVTIMKLQARLDLATGLDRSYAVALEGRTVGLLDRLKPIVFTATSEGVSSGNRLQPALYATTTVKRQKRKGVTIAFTPEAAPVTQFTPADDAEELPPPEVLEGSIDPASAFLTLVRSVADTAACAGTVEVFDGKRRYDVTFSTTAREILQKTSHSPYAGEAKRCQVKMRPVHGFKPGKRRPLDGTTLWFADVLNGAPPLPVRIETEISLGAVRLELTSARWAEQQASR
jgi:hypothetical protein